MKYSWGQTLNTNGPQRLQRFTCQFYFRPSHLDNGSDVDCSKLCWPGAAPSEQLTSLEARAGHILSNVPGEGAFFLVIKNKIYLTIQKVVRYQHSSSVILISSLKNYYFGNIFWLLLLEILRLEGSLDLEHEQTKGQMSLLWWVFVVKTCANTTQRAVLSSLTHAPHLLMFSLWPDLINDHSYYITASSNPDIFHSSLPGEESSTLRKVLIFCLMFDTICHISQMPNPLTHIPQRAIKN